MNDRKYKILITGANSYIGTSFEKWIKENKPNISIDVLDMMRDTWKNFDFSGYDSVFHVAGIAHADVGKASEEQKNLYYKVNSDLTAECAQKAKEAGVGQFIFMSSIIVYGESAGIGKKRIVSRDTEPSPANFYGDSKIKAEEAVQKLEDDRFRVVILRPPMIYGRNSKGNYPLLSKFAQKLPVFPDVKNERSMLYVGNLCKFISLMIENEETGIFYPQNKEYVRTSYMVEMIAKEKGRKIHLVRIFNPFLSLIGKFHWKPGRLVNKAFGNMVYESDLSAYKEEYCIYNLDESVHLTENSGEADE